MGRHARRDFRHIGSKPGNGDDRAYQERAIRNHERPAKKQKATAIIESRAVVIRIADPDCYSAPIFRDRRERTLPPPLMPSVGGFRCLRKLKSALRVLGEATYLRKFRKSDTRLRNCRRLFSCMASAFVVNDPSLRLILPSLPRLSAESRRSSKEQFSTKTDYLQ